MDVQTEKLQLIEWLVSLEDQALIRELIEWKGRCSIDQYNKELDEANSRIESGDFISHEDIVSESKSWLK